MNQSEQINELMGALAKAQGEMSHAIKDSTNPHFKSNYADLASVWNACREPLSKNGLAVTQTMDFLEEKQVLVTTLAHTSGQWVKSFLGLPIQRPGPQELGSCLSYCRRYALAAVVGVYQDDDDGEKAQKDYRKKDEPAKAPVKEPLTQKQKDYMDGLLDQIGDASYQHTIENWCTNTLGLKSPYDMTQDQYNTTIKRMEKKLSDREKDE